MDIKEGQPVSGRSEPVSAEIRVISYYKRRLFGYDGCGDHRRGAVTYRTFKSLVISLSLSAQWSTSGQAGGGYETRASPTLAHV